MHGGRGQATKEDGRLSPELRASAVPRRRRGPAEAEKSPYCTSKPSHNLELPTQTSTTGRRDLTGRQSASEGKGEKWPTEREEPRLLDQKTGSLKDGGTQPGRP
ncbi:hypothetical protein NDU88_003884 [Pleurodeles waltl]|uniref:Uncharacterized protein n=1 Tax=Pleurodeles waltl TaxID=8319 RepID=A0AAV7VH71_PLEWA|nr:hypothetical protein NDU88_003884 [Pleurodeles waltl]